jgi:hypothetical protein
VPSDSITVARYIEARDKKERVWRGVLGAVLLAGSNEREVFLHLSRGDSGRTSRGNMSTIDANEPLY